MKNPANILCFLTTALLIVLPLQAKSGGGSGATSSAGNASAQSNAQSNSNAAKSATTLTSPGTGSSTPATNGAYSTDSSLNDGSRTAPDSTVNSGSAQTGAAIVNDSANTGGALNTSNDNTASGTISPSTPANNQQAPAGSASVVPPSPNDNPVIVTNTVNPPVPPSTGSASLAFSNNPSVNDPVTPNRTTRDANVNSGSAIAGAASVNSGQTTTTTGMTGAGRPAGTATTTAPAVDELNGRTVSSGTVAGPTSMANVASPQVAQDIRATSFTQRNEALTTLSSQLGPAYGSAGAPNDPANARVEKARTRLKDSLDKARTAGESEWPDARNRIASDYEAYANALAENSSR